MLKGWSDVWLAIAYSHDYLGVCTWCSTSWDSDKQDDVKTTPFEAKRALMASVRKTGASLIRKGLGLGIFDNSKQGFLWILKPWDDQYNNLDIGEPKIFFILILKYITVSDILSVPVNITHNVGVSEISPSMQRPGGGSGVIRTLLYCCLRTLTHIKHACAYRIWRWLIVSLVKGIAEFPCKFTWHLNLEYSANVLAMQVGRNSEATCHKF